MAYQEPLYPCLRVSKETYLGGLRSERPAQMAGRKQLRQGQGSRSTHSLEANLDRSEQVPMAALSMLIAASLSSATKPNTEKPTSQEAK
jgi:hypothetical protein